MCNNACKKLLVINRLRAFLQGLCDDGGSPAADATFAPPNTTLTPKMIMGSIMNRKHQTDTQIGSGEAAEVDKRADLNRATESRPEAEDSDTGSQDGSVLQ